MKKRNVFLMLVVFVLGMFAVCFSAKNVKAMEIAEDGEYTLVLSTTWDEDEYIDGKIFKIIRFNLAEDETTVNVSDLTKGERYLMERIYLKIVGKEVVQKK